MNPADEIPVKIDAPESTSAPAGFGDKMDEPVSDIESAGEQRRPVEELHNLLLRISHHLDYETSERSTIYYRLLAIDAQAKKIENQTKRRSLRALFRYAVVIGLAVAGTLAWQSYGEATKQIVATRAPDLGWSPQAKEMIASWVAQLGWNKPAPGSDTAPVGPAVAPQPIALTQAAPEKVEAKAPAIASIDPDQMQQLTASLTALQQSVQQLANAQDQMARQITSLQGNEVEILKRVPTPPPLPPGAPVRKPIAAPSAASSSRAPAGSH